MSEIETGYKLSNRILVGIGPISEGSKTLFATRTTNSLLQNSENIRTTSQLTPLILLHLLSAVSLGTLIIAEFFDLSNEQSFLHLTVVNLVNCLLYIACQLAVL